MSKVELDSTNLKSSCMLNLNDVIGAVNKTLSYFDYFDIPYDFSGRNELREIQSKLHDIKKELSNVKNWIYNSNDNYNTLINNLKIQANRLPNYSFKQRNNII